MPFDVNNLEEIEKVLSGNVNVRNKNLLIKFTVPKTNEEIELDCDHDESKFSERFRDSLREIVKNLNEGEELVLDVEIRLGFKTETTLEQQRAEFTKAARAAEEFRAGAAVVSFDRSNICGPFNPTPNVLDPNRKKLYKKKGLVPVTNLPTNALVNAKSKEFYEKMDATQDDSSYQKRKKNAK